MSKTKVQIAGNECVVTLEDGQEHTYPLNLTYRAALLDHCGDNAKMAAAVDAAINAPDVPAPAAVESDADLDAQIAALRARKTGGTVTKPAAKKPAPKKRK